MKKNILTIGREYGTGGQAMGEKLAEELGFKFYNKQLITELADNLMIPETVIVRSEQNATRKNIFHEFFPFWSNDANDESHYIFEEQGKFIRKLADEGNCIFAGRRADYYLRDYPNAVHLYFHAPLENRIQRVMETENLTAEAAAKKIEATDRMRKNSYEYTTGRTWGDPHNYTLLIDSSAFSEEQIIRLVADVIRNS